MTELTASAREITGKKIASLRKEGKLPAVVYGAKVESTPIVVDEAAFLKVLRDSGETTLIELKGLSEEHEVLIQDIDFDTVKGNPIHVDFYAVERGKEIEVTVPFEFVGESPAEKAGDSIVKTMHEVDVKTTPGKIPAHLEVNLELLKKAGDKIEIKDIAVPEGVTIMAEQEEAVVLAQEHTEEPEEEETTSVDMDSIEVEQKGKGEESSEGEEKSEE